MYFAKVLSSNLSYWSCRSTELSMFGYGFDRPGHFGQRLADVLMPLGQEVALQFLSTADKAAGHLSPVCDYII